MAKKKAKFDPEKVMQTPANITGATEFDPEKHNKEGDQIYQKPDPVVPVEDAVTDTAPTYDKLGLKKEEK